MTRSIVRAAASLAAALSLAACSPSDTVSPELTGDGTVFLAQRTPPDAVMEALYQGRIVRDEAGCLRLDSPEPATVIWPYGFRLEARTGGLYVEDASGRTLGRIGGSFRFGGGFAPTHTHVDLSPADHVLADSRCPGEYWIVGETD